MLKGQFTLLKKDTLTKKGVQFTIDCLRDLVNRYKDREILLNNDAGKIYNLRIEKDVLIADFEINLDINAGIMPITKIATIDSLLITEAKLAQLSLKREKK